MDSLDATVRCTTLSRERPLWFNWLYMDGHAEFLKLASEFPVSVAWAAVVGSRG